MPTNPGGQETPNPLVGFPPSQSTSPAPQRFGMGQLAGGGQGDLAQLQAQSQMEQSAGLLDQLKDLNGQLTDAQDLMLSVATQFPGASQYVRTVVEALDIANRGLVDVLTAVLSQSMSPEPPSPRYMP